MHSTNIKVLDPFTDMCPFCLEQLRRGATEDGKCGHEEILETYPHLRFNARERLDPQTLADSEERFTRTLRGGG